MQGIPGGLSYQDRGGLPDSSPFKPSCVSPSQVSTANSSPSAKSFSFTPTRGRRLYPLLDAPAATTQIRVSPGTLNDNMADDSYLNKDYSSSFISAMDNLEQQMFSSNITNKVLNEFHDRYDLVRQDKITNLENLNNRTSNDELNRRASGRFSRDHRSKFNRMESISTHYAARKAEQKEKVNPRKLFPVSHNALNNKENMSVYDKRLQHPLLESSSKRMKMLDGSFKEIDSSPTKTIQEKKEILNYYQVKLENTDERAQKKFVKPLAPPMLEKKEKTIPSYLLPTRSSIQKSSSSNQISPSKSMSNMKLESHDRQSLAPSPSLSNATFSSRDTSRSSFIGTLKKSPTKSTLSSFISIQNTPQLKKSPSISPSKISPSKGRSNLNAILTGNDEQSILPPPNTMPRSKTTNNVSSRIGTTSSIPTSISSRSFSSRSISGSSSIPRLVSLANSEKITLKKKGWNY